MSTSTRNAPSVLDGLTNVKGSVLTPNDSAYEQARVIFYGGIDRHPAAIVRVSDVDDVRRVIAAARDGGYELAVRSGGHSLLGHGTTEGGIVIDLRSMSSIDIDVRARTAWVGAGATALEFTKALQEHGLVVGFGDSGSVGVGGITLSGGIGFLVRKFGLTIDSLLAAEVVTADGRQLQAEPEHEPDLFWAIRGGGGNFGVVTRFKFRLEELPHFTGGMLILPATPETIVGFANASMTAPDELSTIGNIMPAPPLPFLPAEAHGRLVIFAQLAFSGDDASAQRAIAPFRSLATPLLDTVKAGPYLGMYQPEDPNMHPSVLVRTSFVSSIDARAATTILDHLSKSDAMMRAVQLRALGGAVARVPADATAFAHRSEPMMMNVVSSYHGAADREGRARWVSEFARALDHIDAAYVGFLSDDGPSRMSEAYPGATWERLRRVKSMYDPGNLFRLNHNVPPREERASSRS